MRARTIRLILLSALLAAFVPVGGAATIPVFNTQNAGQGSFRQALLDANAYAGPDLIQFRIPLTDPNFDPVAGVWTIRPLSPLPTITESVGIDGLSQSMYIGADTNPAGPEIQLDGSLAGVSNGLVFECANAAMRVMILNNFDRFGVMISGHGSDSNRITGCYVGTDPTGTAPRPNGASGVLIYTGPENNVIGGLAAEERNVLSGNGIAGLEIQGTDANNNTVLGNFIGTNPGGTLDVGNSRYGVYVWSNAQSNTIQENVISGNDGDAVIIAGGVSGLCDLVGNRIGTNMAGNAALRNDGSGIVIGAAGGNTIEDNLISANGNCGIVLGSGNNWVSANLIGTNAGGGAFLPNEEGGILIHEDAQGNRIGPSNRIGWNGGDGVRVDGAGAIRNTITQNSIALNSGAGINNTNGGNTELAPPDISQYTPTFVSGVAVPNSLVEIFSDGGDEGSMYEGSVIAQPTGEFVWIGSAGGPHVTATVTDNPGNTSEFSAPSASGLADVVPTATGPRVWNRPNPFRPNGVIAYHLAAPGSIRLRIFDANGREVRELVPLRTAPAGPGEVVWDGRDRFGRPVFSGTYYYCLDAGAARAVGTLSLTQ